MALIQTLMQRPGNIAMDSRGFEVTAEGDVTLVETSPGWLAEDGRALPHGASDTPPMPGVRQSDDTQLDLRTFAIEDHDQGDRAMSDALMRCGDVTDVDIPALGAPMGDRTETDRLALTEDITEEEDLTLLDTPTLFVPSLAPSRPITSARSAASTPHRADTPARPTIQISPLGPRQNQPPRVPQATPGNGTKRVLRRNEREAMARVIAMAKPRTGNLTPRPVRTAKPTPIR